MQKAREKYCSGAGLEWIGPDPIISFNMRWGKKYSRTKRQADHPTAPDSPPPKKPKHEPPPALDPNAAPWTILGIDSSGMSDATIKKAYFKLTRIHHPEKGGNEENFQIPPPKHVVFGVWVPGSGSRRAQKRKEGGLWTACSRGQSAGARWQSQ
jgi:hypothetical protein